MMHQTFWWGSNLGDYFIKGLEIKTSFSMAVLCLCLFLLSVTVEILKVHKVHQRAKAARGLSSSRLASENSTLLSTNSEHSAFEWPPITEILASFKEFSIFIFQNLLGYFLMLSVMIFNLQIFIAVVFGAFIGYFFFGHKSMKANMENLQAIRTKLICSARCNDTGEPSSSTTPVFAAHSTGIQNSNSRASSSSDDS